MGKKRHDVGQSHTSTQALPTKSQAFQGSFNIEAICMGLPVEGEVKPLLELLAHEHSGALPEGCTHAPRSARLAQLLLGQCLDALAFDQAVITLDLVQVTPQPRHLRPPPCTSQHKWGELLG